MVPSELGPYVVGEQIGRGGMGAVYRATHQQTGQHVALKALNPQLAASEGFRDRFETEVQSLETLRHAGIVRLYGYGEQDGVLYYAMELVDGPSLEEELRRGRRFTWREAAQLGVQVSRALKHAHDHGVVHRDIKPANLLLTPAGQVKIADFGIARLFGATGVTIAGGVLGTADYMSPEQAAGKPVSARCDQYSLGCVLYTLVTGRTPFSAENLPAMLQLQRYAVAEPLRRFAPEAPIELERIVAQLLEKDPVDRFPNTAMLARRLEAMLRALSRTAADDFEVVDPAEDAALADWQDEGGVAETRVASLTGASISLPGVAMEGNAPGAIRERTTPAAGPEQPQSTLPKPPTRRFTEVPPDDARPHASSWPALLIQGMALVATLAALVAIGVWWSKPPGADALFERIDAAIERGETHRAAQSDVAEFLARFPGDPRADRVEQWSEAIELSLLEKQIKLARGSRGWQIEGEGPTDADDLLHRRLLDLAEADPAAAAERMKDFAALLSEPTAQTDRPSVPGNRAARASLARRQAERLGELAEVQGRLLAEFCGDRLAAARRLAQTDPAAAARLAAALVRLVPRSPATAALLDEAQQIAGLAEAP